MLLMLMESKLIANKLVSGLQQSVDFDKTACLLIPVSGAGHWSLLAVLISSDQPYLMHLDSLSGSKPQRMLVPGSLIYAQQLALQCQLRSPAAGDLTQSVIKAAFQILQMSGVLALHLVTSAERHALTT